MAHANFTLLSISVDDNGWRSFFVGDDWFCILWLTDLLKHPF